MAVDAAGTQAMGTGGHGKSLSIGRAPSRNAAGFLGNGIRPVIGGPDFSWTSGKTENRL
jgi:hypothetical protein